MDVVTYKKKVLNSKKNTEKGNKIISHYQTHNIDPSKNGYWHLKIKSEFNSRPLKVRQKNIQLRSDQIKMLREYKYRSGSIDGIQLNDSEICRVALDLFFGLNIDPKSVSNEKEMLTICKEKISSFPKLNA